MNNAQCADLPVKSFIFSIVNKAGELIGLHGVVHPNVVSLIGMRPDKSACFGVHIDVLPDEIYQSRETLCRRAIQHAIDRGFFDGVTGEREYLERGSPEWTGSMLET